MILASLQNSPDRSVALPKLFFDNVPRVGEVIAYGDREKSELQLFNVVEVRHLGTVTAIEDSGLILVVEPKS